MKNAPDHVQGNPIWQRRGELRFRFGGVKANDDYRLLMESIQAFTEQGAVVEAITLTQTYAEYMESETSPFQQRNHYDAEEYRKRYIELCRRLHPSGRVVQYE